MSAPTAEPTYVESPPRGKLTFKRAAAAGLHAGDLITAVDGTAVIGPSQLVADLDGLKPGDKVTLTVRRGSSTLKLTPTLGREASQAAAG